MDHRSLVPSCLSHQIVRSGLTRNGHRFLSFPYANLSAGHRKPPHGLSTLFPIRPHFPPPPTLEVHRSRIDTQLFQRPTRKMAVIRPLDASIWIITFCIRNHPIQRRPHNLRKQLTNLKFREFVLGRELQGLRKARLVLCL